MEDNLPERQSQSARILYFDYLEAVSIFLVVSVHNVFLKGTILSSIAMSIPAAAVPVFFMVHGALLLNRSASPEKQLRRFFRVLFQLLAWKTIYLLLSLAAGMIAPSDLTLGFFYRYYLQNADLGGFTQGHLWFIYALLSVYLAYPVLCALRDIGEKALCYL